MGLNEFPPGRVLAPLRRRLNAMPPQDVADSLIRHAMAEVSYRSHDPIVTPAGVLPGHLNDQRLHRRPYAWATGMAAVLGTVELARDQSPIPRQNGVWFSDAGHVRESFAPKSFANLGELRPLRIRQTQAGRQVRPQDTVFRGQILVL